MAKIKDFTLENIKEICEFGKAISSPVRLEIIKLLYQDNYSISQIAEALDLPQSSTAFHLKLLEAADLIRMEEQPGSHGTMKVCSRKQDYANLCFLPRSSQINQVVSIEMPVGSFVDCSIFPTCGLYTPSGVVGMEDKEYSFYLPERVNAGLLWTSKGYVQYKFPNQLPPGRLPVCLSFAMEICSEAPGYAEDWRSDITLWVNGIECATWCCPGDFGSRRGRLTPSLWPNGSTQYGIWVKWEIRGDGTYINGEQASKVRLSDIAIPEKPSVAMTIGNKKNARYEGGFNLFGKTFGDYPRDILMEIEY
ncbi:ArsR/SmtB family transcription factor [Lacrimispora defluvii]|uniref:Helix-turn-helix domain-containing protein n=1 Tax=Lacrimispora defluvii TaxID=2719233 RepID=A0ABX1VQI8_9FIRM|nr:ArsR family transcriptional regulator [Lacrimispora defluvii]NNJ30700.1 helix-turn-helix domain-containing protein [Lacrimispora defluvii]